jgi:hypothetical protein
MRSAGIGIASPIGIDSTPEEIDVFNTTTEENTLFIRAVKISKYRYLDQRLSCTICPEIGHIC